MGQAIQYFLVVVWSWGQGARLVLGTTFSSSVTDPALSSFPILGIFVRIAESNPFFTLP
jgi:hypothetical protein